MRHPHRTLALALGLTFFVPMAAAGQPVGHVCKANPTVLGTPPDQPIPIQLKQPDPVLMDMDVETLKQASASVTIEGPARGMVKLGPESKVRFERWVANAANGQDIPFFVQVGHFLAAFTPRSPDDRHTVRIKTPNGTTIRLEGTLIDVQVAPDGSTSVYVIEGAATVTSKSGAKVHLTAGTRTVVNPGQPPTPPAPADPGTGTLSPPAADGKFHGPGTTVIVDPPWLRPQDLQLDLPRLDRP